MKSFLSFLFPALSALLLAPSAALAAIAPNVVRTDIAGLDVIAYKTGVKNVVTIRGSLPAGDAYCADGNIAVATLTGMLLDQGTTKQDKFAIAEKLESVGATIDFSVGTHMAEVSARCLSKDLPLVIELIAEQLRTPALTAEEFEKAKKQFIGGLRRSLESTDFRAADAFTRAVYPVGHPNRTESPEDFIAATEQATLEEVKAFHEKHYGPKNFTLVVVGDIDVAQLQSAVARQFAGWSGGVDLLEPALAGGTDAPREQDIFMADKTSVSVIMGQPSGLRYSDPDYQALRLGTAILGSGFTGRLMANVRDREGLTYGIGSRLDHDTFAGGDWRISATFAPKLLDQGLESTKRQLTEWYEKGATPEEVSRRKENFVGTFKVGLATTGGLAANLLAAIHRGYDVTWLDEYPKKIESLTPGQVNGAIKKYVKPESLYLIKAGSIPTAAK